ncbi:MAG: PLP-dependent transferase [Hyphomicrobiales bacterium]
MRSPVSKQHAPCRSAGRAPSTSSRRDRTHRSLNARVRASFGITDATLRLSIGIEDTPDLIADLAQALGLPSAANPKFASPWSNARGEFRIRKLH